MVRASSQARPYAARQISALCADHANLPPQAPKVVLLPPLEVENALKIWFVEKVRMVVKGIPKGQTFTYGEVARRAGNPRGARAVGAIMRANYDPAIPCHRIVRADGTLGGYNRGGTTAKQHLLERERCRTKVA